MGEVLGMGGGPSELSVCLCGEGEREGGRERKVCGIRAVVVHGLPGLEEGSSSSGAFE